MKRPSCRQAQQQIPSGNDNKKGKDNDRPACGAGEQDDVDQGSLCLPWHGGGDSGL
jgi:hypothetical protein